MEMLLLGSTSTVGFQSLIPRDNFVRHICAGQLSEPHHLFVDSDDNILVANLTSTNPVRVFMSDGTLVKNISIAGQSSALGVCMDPEGRIIAIDYNNSRILVI